MSSSGEKGFAYLGLGGMASFSLCHLLLCHRGNLPWNENVRLNVQESKDIVYNFGSRVVTLWYSGLLMVIAEMKCYTRINASQTLSITPLSLFHPSPLVCPNSTILTLYTPSTSVLCRGKWRLLSLIFSFLSSPLFTHCSASQLIWLWQNNAAVGGHSRTD